MRSADGMSRGETESVPIHPGAWLFVPARTNRRAYTSAPSWGDIALSRWWRPFAWSRGASIRVVLIAVPSRQR